MKKTIHQILCLTTAAALLMAWLTLTTGCRYMSIPAKDDAVAGQDQSKEEGRTPLYNSAVIKGRLVGPDANRTSTLIVAYKPGNATPVYTEYVVAAADGTFMLYLPQGHYQLFAITDYNSNGFYEIDEVSGQYGTAAQPQRLSIRECELITGVTIAISRNAGQNVKLPLEWHPKDDQRILKQITHNGQVLKIYHEYFSPENAQIGYWNPSSFMKVFGAHIYMTQKYDPNKIPVLFVHGTEGTPHNWIYFYMRMDLNRYQPWFFYYPSGIRLGLAAALLNEELRELYRRYGYSKMIVVAHSVGGLTTRCFLTRFGSEKPHEPIRTFVSLATPWSGFSAADASQIIVHKSIPAWIDLGTKSDFIQNTLDSRLSKNIHHYIFYGKNDRLCREAALDHRALSCAVKFYAFDCDHTSILEDRNVFAQFQKILKKELE